MTNNNINEVLHKIQKELVAPKGQYNSFGKYNYRSCEDIVEAVKNLLPDGFTLTLSDEMVMLGDRFYVQAQAILFGNGDKVVTYGFAREAQAKKGMDDAQVTGAASSYARKYALNGLFAIDDSKDSDTDENHTERKEAQKKADEEYAKRTLDKETPEQVKDRLVKAIKKLDDSSKLSDFERNQKVIEARDKLFLDDVKLSAKVDMAVTDKQASFLQSPSQAAAS